MDGLQESGQVARHHHDREGLSEGGEVALQDGPILAVDRAEPSTARKEPAASGPATVTWNEQVRELKSYVMLLNRLAPVWHLDKLNSNLVSARFLDLSHWKPHRDSNNLLNFEIPIACLGLRLSVAS